MQEIKVWQALAKIYEKFALITVVMIGTVLAMHDQLAPALYLSQLILEAELMLNTLEDLSERD